MQLHESTQQERMQPALVCDPSFSCHLSAVPVGYLEKGHGAQGCTSLVVEGTVPPLLAALAADAQSIG